MEGGLEMAERLMGAAQPALHCVQAAPWGCFLVARQCFTLYIESVCARPAPIPTII